MFDSYAVNIDFLDIIPCVFDDLDVSAKTVKGVIYLNLSLLEDGEYFRNLSYIVHEADHTLQQITGKEATQNTDVKSGDNYLSSPEELSAFKIQVDYLEDEFGKAEANDYVNHLMEYHDTKDKELKRELLD